MIDIKVLNGALSFHFRRICQHNRIRCDIRSRCNEFGRAKIRQHNLERSRRTEYGGAGIGQIQRRSC